VIADNGGGIDAQPDQDGLVARIVAGLPRCGERRRRLSVPT